LSPFFIAYLKWGLTGANIIPQWLESGSWQNITNMLLFGFAMSYADGLFNSNKTGGLIWFCAQFGPWCTSYLPIG